MKEVIEAINKVLPPFVQLTEQSPPADLWAALFRLYGEQVQGPKGHATWKDAALAELLLRTRGVQGTATTAREDAKKARPPSDAEPWIVADDEGVRVTFRSEDAAWRYRNEYTDRLTNPTVTHEPATPGVPASAPLRTALDLTLTQGEAQNITAFLDDDAESDAEVVRLLIGDGHSGYGLYAAHPDYPGEGAMLVKNLPAPDGVKGPDHG